MTDIVQELTSKDKLQVQRIQKLHISCKIHINNLMLSKHGFVHFPWEKTTLTRGSLDFLSASGQTLNLDGAKQFLFEILVIAVTIFTQ